MWAWGADQRVRFWSRRQLHETLVHRIDVELALGLVPAASPAVAADAIDEFLVNLSGAAYFSSRVKDLRGDGERLSFQATDQGREWSVSLLPEGFEVGGPADPQCHRGRTGTRSAPGALPPSAARRGRCADHGGTLVDRAVVGQLRLGVSADGRPAAQYLARQARRQQCPCAREAASAGCVAPGRGVGVPTSRVGGRAGGQSAGDRVAVAVYTAGVTGMYATSACYHRGHWAAPAKRRMRRLDHSMILVAIASTYTPVAVIGLSSTTAWPC